MEKIFCFCAFFVLFRVISELVYLRVQMIIKTASKHVNYINFHDNDDDDPIASAMILLRCSNSWCQHIKSEKRKREGQGHGEMGMAKKTFPFLRLQVNKLLKV